jgi:L-threonylcarbamoyladenylate synthase
LIVIPDSEKARQLAAGIIAKGGLIAFRTDTFYGLGANPFNRKAVLRIKELKGRDTRKPILLLIADETDLEQLIAKQSNVFAELARRFWPGPLTLIAAAKNTLSPDITAGTGTVGVRLPKDESVRSLVRCCGGALTATSANLSGSEPSRSAEQVKEYFPHGLDLIIDSGEVTATEPSTVLNASSIPPFFVREGAISRKQIESLVLDNLRPLV